MVTSSFSPAITLHSKYAIMYLLLCITMLIHASIVIPVLILTRAIICMQMQVGLSKIVILQKVMKHGDDTVCTFANIVRFINEIVDLFGGSIL